MKTPDGEGKLGCRNEPSADGKIKARAVRAGRGGGEGQFSRLFRQCHPPCPVPSPSAKWRISPIFLALRAVFPAGGTA